MMNRRRFFQMAAGVLGALAIPVPRPLYRWTYSIPTDQWRWRLMWSKARTVGIFPRRSRPFADALKNLTLTPSRAWFRLGEVGKNVKLSQWKE